MEKFLEAFRKRYDLKADDCVKLLEIMTRVEYSKGDYLVREGEVNTSYYIIAEGIWRGHYLRNGEELSLWFASSGESLFSTLGYVGNKPSQIYIEAMTDSVLYKVSRARLEDFFNSSIQYSIMGRKLWQYEFLVAEERIVSTGVLSQAKERYLDLLEKAPHLLQHVPLKYIASYLFITPQSLSRIRAELAKTVKERI